MRVAARRALAGPDDIPHRTAHRPHDLLWLADAAALTIDGPRPPWAKPHWLAVAPVVVRRAMSADPRQLPVGLRGAMRNQRCAAQVSALQVVRAQTPEEVVCAWLRGSDDLVSGPLGRDALARPGLPCLQALVALAPLLNALPLAWGVTGSVGFTLASGFDMLRQGSDLDLLVRAPAPADAVVLRRVAALLGRTAALLGRTDVLLDPTDGLPGRTDGLLGRTDVRVDVQVETPLGAFALQEWLRTGGPVLLKTAGGPMLCEDAWHPPQGLRVA